ncbi:polyamine aminopropyltransferase [Streptomyces tanashiensis]|uniref:Polyamine aminopropyltransferase n=1 Tax=Streptomyces tanashiensis TaxID=67367 RepID=A0ABY6QZ86_9ACTN|nr:polyamine aminopropyltransferase [Streptomyces tanashiensis]UZX23115.1 polyamine aminopropyltransferase [Streptomyces tanashiensis]
MIEPTVTMPPKRVRRPPPRRSVRPPREAVRFRVLAVVFVCAACGLVYELELVALASYLIGDSVTQASVVLSVMVFAMGVGSLLAKRLRCRAAVGFGLVEAGLALIGGCSAMVLYASFAWLGESRYVVVAFSLAIGVLIGAEIPLLMSLIQRAGRSGGPGSPADAPSAAGRTGRQTSLGEQDDAAGTVADLFAADYVGALVGGLAFPFLLLPWLGQLTGALVTGAVNAVAGGGLVLWVFRRDLTRRSRALLLAVNLCVLGVLATATVLVDDFEQAARRAVYGERVRVAVHTDLQEVVVTGGVEEPPDLFLDGRLRVAGRDEYRYHEALVHPAMNGAHARVLIVGGGDGMAAREALRYAGVRSVTVVELDPGVVRLARTDPALAALNAQAFRDPRVRVVHADAFRWLRGAADRLQERYDVVISDLPDPGITPSTKLYSEEFYGLVARVLTDSGRFAVHAGSVTDRPRTYWTVDATLRAAGFTTRPYSASGRTPGFAAGPDRADRTSGTERGPGDWGFLLAVQGGRPPALGLAPDAPRLRSLPAGTLESAARRAERTRGAPPPPSTLVHPRYGA